MNERGDWTRVIKWRVERKGGFWKGICKETAKVKGHFERIV